MVNSDFLKINYIIILLQAILEHLSKFFGSSRLLTDSSPHELAHTCTLKLTVKN